jgi:ABC-type amino acid transport substrate-binding protein
MGGPWLAALVMVAGPEPPASPVRVGVETAPPFVLQTDDGSWGGVSVGMWRVVADELGWDYELVEHPERDLIDLVRAGEVDVGIGAFTLDPADEKVLDFTHAYLHAGLSIATSRHADSGVLRALYVLGEPRVTRSILAILGIVVVVGIIIWLIEHRRAEGDRTILSIEDGFWWSVVTMTTVGYGDKTPRTRAGRFLAAVWMLLSLVLLSVFTAVLASAFTAAELKQVDSPDDLLRSRVGAVQDSNGAAYLTREAIDYRHYPFLLHALRALRRGELDAVVYDAPTLRYVVDDFDWHDLELGRRDFEPLHYAFVLPSGSPLRESINIALLRHAPRWRREVGMRAPTR